MQSVSLKVGSESWRIELSERTAVPELAFEAERTAAPVDAGKALTEAVLHPVRFEPLARMFTPDDRVAIVFDPALADAGPILESLLAYLHKSGIDTAKVTVILPEGTVPGPAFAGVTVEIHDPNERPRLSYLANTAKGSRVYLNMTLVDAEQSILVARRGYDQFNGHAGPEGLLFPTLSDRENLAKATKLLRFDPPTQEAWPTLEETREVAWLLGLPFLIHVREEGGKTVGIRAGLLESAEEIADEHDAMHRGKLEKRVAAAVGTFSGTPTFRDLARAALSLGRAVEPDGILVLLTDADFDSDPSVQFIQLRGSARQALKDLDTVGIDPAAVFAWCHALNGRRVYLASKLDSDVTESLHASKLNVAAELQRLLQGLPDCLFVTDAQDLIVEAG